MINITTICQKYGKRACHFLDNPRIRQIIKDNQYTVNTIAGRYGGGSWIDDRLYNEFVIWLDKNTHQDIHVDVEALKPSQA